MVVRTCIAASLFNALVGARAKRVAASPSDVAGLFGGFSAASMALVGTQVPEERLGFSLGWLSTGQLVGTLLGPLIGGLLPTSFTTTASSSSRPRPARSLARSAAWRSSRSTTSSGRPGTASANRSGRSWPRCAHTALFPLFTVVMLAQFTARGAAPIIPLFVEHLLGNSPWLATAAGAAIAVTGIAEIIASPWLGKRSDTLGYRSVLLLSLAGGAAFTLPAGLAASIWVFLALRFGVGIFLGGILPSANAWIGRLFPRERRGQIYGMTSSASFLGLPRPADRRVHHRPLRVQRAVHRDRRADAREPRVRRVRDAR